MNVTNKCLLLVFLASVKVVSGQNCTFEADEDDCLSRGGRPIMRWAGEVNDAHASLLNYANFVGVVCCTEVAAGDTETLYLNSPHGDAHASNDSMTWSTPYAVNTTASSCYITSTSCAIEDICIAKMSSTHNAHIGDCTTTFHYTLCCTPGEICDDGLDNDRDTYIDCADDDCHGTALKLPRGNCLGTVQTSNHCYQNPDECTSNTGDVFYCSDGINGEATNEGINLCCPVTQRAEKDLVDGQWKCFPTAECYNPENPLSRTCQFEYDNFTEWINSTPYDTTPLDWCVDASNPSGALACCSLVKYGNFGYYSEDSTAVKIY